MDLIEVLPLPLFPINKTWQLFWIWIMENVAYVVHIPITSSTSSSSLNSKYIPSFSYSFSSTNVTIRLISMMQTATKQHSFQNKEKQDHQIHEDFFVLTTTIKSWWLRYYTNVFKYAIELCIHSIHSFSVCTCDCVKIRGSVSIGDLAWDIPIDRTYHQNIRKLNRNQK